MFGMLGHASDTSAALTKLRVDSSEEAFSLTRLRLEKSIQRGWLKFLAVLLLALTGCLSHTQLLQQPKLAGPVVDADALQLVRGINERYDQLHSFAATMDFTASVGGTHRGERTDYSSCLGYILFRKPQMLRVLILVPVLHVHAIDLTSNGTSFTLLIPSKNRAIEGRNSVAKPADNPLENLRPNLFADTILIHSISPDQIVSVIHQSATAQDARTKQLVELPAYDLTVLSEAPPTQSPAPAQVAKPLRVIRFSRLDLLPIEQDIYDANGDLETQVLYGPYQDFGGTQFPSTIDINRPLDEYRIRLTVNKLTVNQPLRDDQFELKIPEGIHVQKLE